VLLASACGAGSEAVVKDSSTTTEARELTAYEVPDAGLTISFPPGWQRSTEPLLPGLADPRELVAVSTFDPRAGGENCAHMPENAVEGLGASDALLVIEERLAEFDWGTPSDYPQRPGHFGPGNGYPSETVDCLDQHKEFFDRFIPFRAAGRRFYAYVAFGRETPPAIRAEAWAILDRLEIESSPRR
jgi:hypothetical protein